MDSVYDGAMRLALTEAEAALATGDVPVGAVVLAPGGGVIGVGRNLREATHDPTGHAEVVAMRARPRRPVGSGGWTTAPWS